MKKDILNIAKQVASLPEEDRRAIETSNTKDLPAILQEVGILLPTSSWWLRVLKVILYGLGIILAGIGTADAATIMTSIY